MADFTILTGSDIVDWNDVQQKAVPFRGMLNYSESIGFTFLFNNFPETMTEINKSWWLGDNGVYLNKAHVTTFGFKIYASYVMNCDQAKVFGVRVYNAGPSAVTIRNPGRGFKIMPNNSWDIAMRTYEEFNIPKNDTYTIPPGQEQWIHSGTVPSNNFVELLSQYTCDTVSPDLYVALYMATDLNRIPATTRPMTQIDYEYYVGYGNKISVGANLTYYTSYVYSQPDNSVYNSVACAEISGNRGERVNLNLVQNPNIIASEFPDTAPYNKLGPYAIDYGFHHTFYNDTQYDVIIRGYLNASPASHCAGLRSGNDVKAKFLGLNGNGLEGKNRWHFYESPRIIKNGGSAVIDFQYMMLSKGVKHGIIQYKAFRV